MSTYRKKDHIRITDPTVDRAIRNIEGKSVSQNRFRNKEVYVKWPAEMFNGKSVFVRRESKRHRKNMMERSGQTLAGIASRRVKSSSQNKETYNVCLGDNRS